MSRLVLGRSNAASLISTPEMAARFGEQSSSMTKRIMRLDRALRFWAVRKYELVSAGPPPVYKRPWADDDQAIVRAWALFGAKWEGVRKQLVEAKFPPESVLALEHMDIGLTEFERRLRAMGVNPEEVDAQVGTANIGPKTNPWMTWAVAGGFALLAWPQVRDIFFKKVEIKPIFGPGEFDEMAKLLSRRKERNPMPRLPPPSDGPTFEEEMESIASDMRERDEFEDVGGDDFDDFEPRGGGDERPRMPMRMLGRGRPGRMMR